MVALIPIAFGFGNLAMLGWLAAAAAPILIHLWMRHTHRDTPWAAMEFLREAIKRNARRLKLQQWLLLAVRTLLLLLLALAAAKPYLSGWNLFTGGAAVYRILVLDASLSMQYVAGDESRLEQAKRLAIGVLEGGNQGDTYSLCLLAEPPEVIVAGPVADVRSVRAQLSALQPTYATASLANTLTTIEELVAESPRTDSACEVLFFTDLAAHTWQAAGDQAAISAQLDRMAKIARMTIVDVGERASTNVAVRNLRLAGSLATTAEPVRLECEVANYGETPVENILVQIVADGVGAGEQTVSLTAGGQATLDFEVQLPEPGWQTIGVRTSDDALAADDQAWLALDVRRQLRALLVEGKPGAARYLRHALDPGGGKSPIQALVVPEGALVETPLDEFDFIFLCNVARFTARERLLLTKYTELGGNLVFFLGDRVLPESYNEVLACPLPGENMPFLRATARLPRLQVPTGTPLLFTSEAPLLRLARNAGQADLGESLMALLPASIGVLKTSTEFGLNPLDYRHPIAAAFRGSERAGLLSTPVSRYYELTPIDGAEVVLALPDGEPFMVTAPFGHGMVTVVATSASLDTVDAATAQPWTMLPAWPSFLPIVRELVVYGIEHGQAKNLAEPGLPISGWLPSGFSGLRVEVDRPDGRVDTIPVERSAASVGWTYASANFPGAYSIMPATTGGAISKVAVNVPASESNLAQVAVEALPASLVVQTAAPNATGTAREVIAETAIHRWLLYAVLALLLVESVMAWAFAGRAA